MRYIHVTVEVIGFHLYEVNPFHGDYSDMTAPSFSTEKRVLMAMRKTLAKVVRDLTPNNPTARYPLSDDTVADMKACFDLIASRERELMQAAGTETKEKPRFIDDDVTQKVISIDKLTKNQT